MTEKVQAKFVFKNVFRTVDDWLKDKEHEINKSADIQNYMQEENDELVFKNAYKNFDQYVNNVFSSDQSIKDYIRGRNQEQQKIYDSNFFRNVFSRSLEHQHQVKQKNNNSSPQHSPLLKQNQSPKILRPLNLKKINNASPDININASTTSYGSFRDKGKKESDFFNKTSHFFQTQSKLTKKQFPQVKVHKFKMQEFSLKSPSKQSQEGSLKLINSSLKEGSLKSNGNLFKDGSINYTSSKAIPIIELEAEKLLEMKMPDEKSNIHDYLKDSADNLMKVENDIFNNHFLTSKVLFKDSTDTQNNHNKSTTFLLQNSQRILGDSEFIPPPKRVFNKQTHQQLQVIKQQMDLNKISLIQF